MTLLSKSKYLIGIQCPKYLWISLHQPERIPEPDISTQHRFDQGHEVGELAKKLFPEGINIPYDDFKENLEKTKKHLKDKKPLFEPAFLVNNIYARADILVPVGKEWDIIEVKSSTKAKEINCHDLSFQKYVYEKAGLKIRKCFLMVINNQYVKQGDIDPKKLFKKEDLTKEVNLLMADVEDNVKNMFKIIENDICPDIKISKDCADPYLCPLEEECWGFLPESSVFDLYRGGKTSFELYENGVLSIKDIPKEFILSDKQGIQHDCDINNKIHVDKPAIKSFLDKLQKPLHYLDFETFMTPIPILDGTRPYQQIPFQFSLHIDDKDIKHYEFLASGKEDPRISFLKELKDNIKDNGSIMVFNQSFEITRLKELALSFPEYKEWIESLLPRIIDLIIPFRDFSYYNPKQKGSCSIKDVLPAITNKDYSELNIQGGDEASILYLSMTYADGEDVREDLLKYCELDTEAMVLIVNELRKIVRK